MFIIIKEYYDRDKSKGIKIVNLALVKNIRFEDSYEQVNPITKEWEEITSNTIYIDYINGFERIDFKHDGSYQKYKKLILEKIDIFNENQFKTK